MKRRCVQLALVRSRPFVLLGALALGCARPAQQRAERDLEVGKAASRDVNVLVVDGLAAVRSLEAERLVLWSSAPAWELELDSVSGGNLRLDVENCIADVELTALSSDVSVASVATQPITHKSWTLQLPPGRSRFRFAPPDFETRQTFRFALMSDVQEAIDRVQDIYSVMNQEPDLRFLLGAGDLTQRGTVEEVSRFQTELASLNIPYYTTLGNHELGTTPPPYQAWFGRGSSQFVYRGVYFTLLDSASATLDPIVYAWLGNWLARGRDAVHLVAMHIPPLDPIGVRNGAFGSRGEAAALLADFAENGVDLTLYGHIHSYYEFDNAGIPAFISGGGGAIPERFDNIGRHFLVIEVNADSGVESTRIVRVDKGD